MLQRLRTRLTAGDTGAAMITTILVMVVVTGMGTVAVQVASSNLRNVGRDRVAGGALGAAEAGLSAGQSYIRGSAGISSLSCSPTCPSNPWGNQASPYELVIDGNRKAEVWIDEVLAFDPANGIREAEYKITSTGTTGTGPGTVVLEQTVNAKPFQFPIGVYADSIGAAGGAAVHNESFFTKGCVNKRSHMDFQGWDEWYDIPAAVYSTQYITESNNGCSANDNSNIHKPKTPASAGYCNTSSGGEMQNDKDALGGPLAGTACEATAGTTSLFTLADLEETYGQQSRGLTQAQYAALKARAQEIGQYYTTTSYTAPDSTVYPNAVMYFKLSPGQKVMVQNQLNAYSSTTCGTKSLIIVIEGGDLHVNAGADITGAIFLPDGTYTGNGSAVIYGTLYAKYIEKFNGTADFYLDPCFFSNLPGGLLEVTPKRFRVADRD